MEGGNGFKSKAAATVEVAEPDLFTNAESGVRNILNDGTTYSVYLAFPQISDETFLYHSQQMRSASMIKVFIMAAVMERAAAGAIDIDEPLTLTASDKVGGAGILAGYANGTVLPLREVMRLMITESDNTATNMVIDRIGMNTVNDYLRCHGYSDTILQRKMMDTAAIQEGRENYSSVTDLGNIFLKMYHHNCVGSGYDEIMLEFLQGQTDTDCFPAALPGKMIAHKTGALIGLYDDGGIIYNGQNDAVLVIMTENYTDEYTAMERMRQFARAVIP